MNKLLDWKKSPYRKPLILKGVRQVGKTWVLKEFGRRYYENTAYFNFDENEEYKQFFETTKDVNRILQNLMLASAQKIVPEKTLIIFDEVQDCPKVDRKSTRLNSSHVSISYAVFCLKKKNKLADLPLDPVIGNTGAAEWTEDEDDRARHSGMTGARGDRGSARRVENGSGRAVAGSRR